MQYLSENDHPGDWTMPEGLYRSGDYVFKDGARNNWITQTPQQPITEVSNVTTESQTSVTETTDSNTTQTPSTPNTNQNPQQTPRQNQNSQRQQ
jgi:penicillin-binding protein 1A